MLKELKSAAGTQQPFHAAVLDYLMPEMDGEVLVRKIVADPDISETPLMMLTSAPSVGDGHKFSKLGVAAYLTKPIKQTQLYTALALVIGSSHPRADKKERPLITKHTVREVSRPSAAARILLAEDNPVNQAVAVGMLKKLGYTCDVAPDGQAAVEAVLGKPPTLVFMDCQMPILSGLEATAKIRKAEKDRGTQHTTIVAMTANAMEGDREKCLEAGMDDYIAKPIRLDSLKEILDRHLPVENETPSKLPRVSWCSNPLILPPERSGSFSALAALRHGLQFGLRPSPPLVKLAAEGGSDSARTKCRAPRTHSSHSWRASLARWGEILYSCAHMMKMDGQEEKGVGP